MKNDKILKHSFQIIADIILERKKSLELKKYLKLKRYRDWSRLWSQKTKYNTWK